MLLGIISKSIPICFKILSLLGDLDARITDDEGMNSSSFYLNIAHLPMYEILSILFSALILYIYTPFARILPNSFLPSHSIELKPFDKLLLFSCLIFLPPIVYILILIFAADESSKVNFVFSLNGFGKLNTL